MNGGGWPRVLPPASQESRVNRVDAHLGVVPEGALDGGGSVARRGAGCRRPRPGRSPIATNVQTTAATMASVTTDQVGNIDFLCREPVERLGRTHATRSGVGPDRAHDPAAGDGTARSGDTSGNSAITRMPRPPQAEHRPAPATGLSARVAGGKGARKPATPGREAAQYAPLSPPAYDVAGVSLTITGRRSHDRAS
jgi:hypothetical protein